MRECSIQVMSDRKPNEVCHSNRSWTQTAYKSPSNTPFTIYDAFRVSDSLSLVVMETVLTCKHLG